MLHINVMEYFLRTAKNHPAKIACQDKYRSISFEALAKECFTLSSNLLNTTSYSSEQARLTNIASDFYHLYNPPQCYALFLPKSIESLVALFGVLLSGNMYMPLDVKSPKERLRNILCNIQPQALIADTKHLGVLSDCLGESFDSKESVCYLESNCQESFCMQILLIEDLLRESIMKQTKYQYRIDTDPAYIINTSGSTGIPKGVVVSHRSVIDYIEWIISEDSLRPSVNDIIGNQSPFYFDKSLFDIYPSIALGVKLLLIPEEKFLFPLELLRFVEQKHVNYIYWVPSILKNIANLDLLKVCKPKLEKIFFGGEAINAKTLNYWIANYPNATFANLYGPSEITDICAYHIVKRTFHDKEIIPIGKACRNTQILLLDSGNKLIHTSFTTGELYIRGSCLSLQYCRDTEKSQRAFIQNPLHTNFYDKVYKTGDLGYYNEHGEIVLVGRKDFQIKHNGYRIELGEIENILANHKKIQDVCVLYRQEEIVLCYQGETITHQEIIQYCKDKIPKYAMPSKLFKIDSMPLNANGKIDRQKLLDWLKLQS
ncbi:hypothetical protein CQA66_02145 [Helicobacter aurati]|uniref:AMP-dependent synthetase/ligase domain-containing protein n=1 Tax=Helicobacter aurati TaxID=137778 RepID=A0A3D8J6I3_9HELI|nr:AMP-binding protein [Helicobacter aurati]RDU73058.1 hypothetical protein CQA66_02145 [Helicobacter aurati]